MTDLATLGLAVQSDQVKRATAELRKMPGAAGAAEQSVKKLGHANDNAAESANRMTRNLRMASAGVSAFIRALAPLGAALLAAFSVKPVFAFMDAMAEVSTLVDTATFRMDALSDAALRQSTAFGGGAAQQAKAYYQIISAGASSAAEATDTLTAANRLAVGGVTQVSVAADGLTSVLNAYGDKVDSATSVSDSLFVAMKAGKTTIGEMSASLGKVAPLAASTGVTFDELAASVAALTKGGISTNEAITGVRAVLAAVAKPTSEASKLAKRLGLEFNSTALKSKGFAGFLQDLAKRTGGNTDALSQLFGGVEALVPIMALSGQAGIDFNNIMDQMANKAGATEEAFNKMANSPGFQSRRIWSALEAEVIKAGLSMGEMLVPVLKAVADNMENLFRIIKIVGAALLVAFAPSMLSAMAFSLGYLGAAGVAAIRMITAAIATNPFGALAVAITILITAVYQFRDEISQVIGVDVMQVIKQTANQTIGAFVGAYNAVIEAWGNLPVFFRALGKKSWNALMAELEKPALTIGGKVIIPGLDMTGQKSLLTREEEAAFAGASATFNESMAKDYIGDLGGVFAETTPEVQDFNQAMVAANDNLSGMSGLAGDAAKKTKEVATEAQKAAKAAREFGSSVTSGFVADLRSGLEQGKSLFESFKDAALNALDKVIDKLTTDFTDALFKANEKAASIKTGGGQGGNFWGTLISAFTGAVGFAAGGYTGMGAAHQVAGVVHGGEYVFSKKATDQIGVGNLDRMHKSAKGFASGGYVGSGGGSMNVKNIINTPPGYNANVEQREEKGEQINEFSFVEAVAGAVSTPQFKKAMASNFDLAPATNKVRN